jgi:hypothetical protein
MPEVESTLTVDIRASEEATLEVDVRGVVAPLWVEVYNSKTLLPIVGATVLLSCSTSSQEKETNAEGKAYFEIIETDFYDFNISKAGYEPQTRTVKLFGPYENIMEVDIRAMHENIMEVEVTP